MQIQTPKRLCSTAFQNKESRGFTETRYYLHVARLQGPTGASGGEFAIGPAMLCREVYQKHQQATQDGWRCPFYKTLATLACEFNIGIDRHTRAIVGFPISIQAHNYTVARLLPFQKPHSLTVSRASNSFLGHPSSNVWFHVVREGPRGGMRATA